MVTLTALFGPQIELFALWRVLFSLVRCAAAVQATISAAAHADLQVQVNAAPA